VEREAMELSRNFEKEYIWFVPIFSIYVQHHHAAFLTTVIEKYVKSMKKGSYALKGRANVVTTVLPITSREKCVKLRAPSDSDLFLSKVNTKGNG
jgi:hypothetical protein